MSNGDEPVDLPAPYGELIERMKRINETIEPAIAQVQSEDQPSAENEASAESPPTEGPPSA